MRRDTSKQARSKQAGFTLVEVLISMFIFSLLSTATLSVLLSTLQNKEHLSQKNEQLRQIDNLRIHLKSDLAQTLNVTRPDEFGRVGQESFSGGLMASNKVLSLSRSGWLNPGGFERRSDLQAVDYTFDQGVFTRNIRARFNAVANTPTYQQVLAQNVKSLKVTFFDGEYWVDNWLTGEPPLGTGKLPELAALDIVFESGEDLRQIFYVGVGQ